MARKPSTTTSEGEKVKRLTPSDETLRSLYLRSGNLCAVKSCNTVIINNSGVMTGHICHIEAAMPDGARYNPNMTNEQRRQADNLMLLCAVHHAAIDGSPGDYTKVKLNKIKREHEQRFSEVGDTLKRWFEDSYVDNTTLIQETVPKSLKRFRDYLEGQKVEFTDDHAKKAISEIKKYVARARLVPQPERAFMKLLFERAKRRGFSYGRVSVDFDDFKSAFSYPVTRIKRQIALLEQNSVGSLDPEDNDRASLRLFDPSDYVTWSEIDAFCEAHSLVVERFLLELQFGLLD
jgi:hypothetical protein